MSLPLFNIEIRIAGSRSGKSDTLGYFIEGVSLYDTSHPFYFYPIGVGLIMSQSDISRFTGPRCPQKMYCGAGPNSYFYSIGMGLIHVPLFGDEPSPCISLR
jgi:hypothetical protein